MSRTTMFWIVFGSWAMLFALSFIIAAWAAADMIGLDAGFKRIGLFTQFQFGAVIMAVLSWSLGRRFDRPGARWLSRHPGLIALAMAAGLACVVLWAMFADPSPVQSTPAMPITKPVAQP